MLTESSFAIRRIAREVNARVYGFDRYVDIGVEMHVVKQSADGEHLLPSGIRVKTLRVHRWGGMLDTKSNPPRICGPSIKPRMWMCSEDQEPIIMHDDAGPLAWLVIGSEGSGKTTGLSMWHHRMWVKQGLGEFREGGQTAPTLNRLGLVKDEILKLWPGPWRRYVNRDDFVGFELPDGCRIRFVSTAKRPEKQGSPIQGFNWSWCGRDEMQDQVDVHSDIESRGRAARGGRYKQLATATAKDEPEWRTLRDKLEAAKGPAGPLWGRSTLYGRRSPFVSAGFWDAKRETMSPREYRRRVECIDVGPERATYPDWTRSENLITVPEIGWTDVTSHELKHAGDCYDVLVGHDPGALWDVSLFLKAYVRNERAYARGLERPFWVVLGELNTEQSTTAKHIDALLDYVRDRWSLNLLTPQGRLNPHGRQILVRADPADSTDRENASTHRSVYTQFANAGIKIKPAAYNAENDGHGKVPKDPGIEVINTLICDASTPPRRRLFVARNPDGSPAAPMLVRSIEQAERDERGKAETQRKGTGDISHWSAALRYALWAIERPRLQRLAGRAGA